VIADVERDVFGSTWTTFLFLMNESIGLADWSGVCEGIEAMAIAVEDDETEEMVEGVVVGSAKRESTRVEVWAVKEHELTYPGTGGDCRPMTALHRRLTDQYYCIYVDSRGRLSRDTAPVRSLGLPEMSALVVGG
jgi:hypothetical protein